MFYEHLDQQIRTMRLRQVILRIRSFVPRDLQLVLPNPYHHQAGHASGLGWKQRSKGVHRVGGGGQEH